MAEIFFTSDTHSYVFPTDYISGGKKDLGYIAAASRFTEGAIIVDGGDVLQGSPLIRYELENGIRPFTAVEAFNRAGLSIYTPGNHDLYVRNRLCRAACREFTEKITNGLMRLDGYPYAFTLGPLRFLVFNGARPTNPVLSCGFLGEAARTMIREECARKQLPIVAVCHFPFRRIRRGLVNGMRHRLFGAKEAARALSEEKTSVPQERAGTLAVDGVVNSEEEPASVEVLYPAIPEVDVGEGLYF